MARLDCNVADSPHAPVLANGCESLKGHLQELQRYVAHWAEKHEALVEAKQRVTEKAPCDAVAEPHQVQLHAPKTESKHAGFADTSTSECAESALTPALVQFQPLQKSVDALPASADEAPLAVRTSQSSTSEVSETSIFSVTRNFQRSGTSMERSEEEARLDCAFELGGVPITNTHSEKARAEVLFTTVLSNPKFEGFCALVIITNAITMGIGANYSMAHLDEEDGMPLISVLEVLYTAWYFLEICMRICVQGPRKYFWGEDLRWNWLDCFLVAQAVFEQIWSMAVKNSPMQNLSFLRALRLLKMMKLLRMVKLMKVFRELRLIMYSVIGSAKSMLWAFVLIAIVSYMFGIVFLQACTIHLQDADVSVEITAAIEDYWSSVASCMLSLYMGAMGGDDWGVFAKPLRDVGSAVFLLFLVYIAFFEFAILNIVSSLFIQAMIMNAEQDQTLVIQQELEKKGEYVRKLRTFFNAMDESGDGLVSYEELSQHIEDPQLQAFAASLDINATDIDQFFCILSNQGERPVDLETFVIGCIKLKGTARSMDLMDLTSEFKYFQSACVQELQAMKALIKHSNTQVKKLSLEVHCADVSRSEASRSGASRSEADQLSVMPSAGHARVAIRAEREKIQNRSSPGIHFEEAFPPAGPPTAVRERSDSGQRFAL